MGLVDIIESIPGSATPEQAAEAVRQYALRKSRAAIKKELSKQPIRIKKKVSRRIKRHNLELLLFCLATGITAQEEMTSDTSSRNCYHRMTGLVSALSGRRMKYLRTRRYLLEIAERDGLPLLTKKHQRYVDNFNSRYVKRTPKKRLAQELGVNIGFRLGESLFLRMLSRKVAADPKLQYEFLKKWTGARTREELPKSMHMKGMVSFFVGKSLSYDEAQEHLDKIIQENNMPLLTAAHQRYLDSFDVEYVRRTPRAKLKRKICIGKGDTIRNNMFLSELSRKVSADPKIQYELFKKWTEIEALEQIRVKRYWEIPGYHSLRALVHFISGESISVTAVGEYLRTLCKRHGMPLLTRRHREYIESFSAEYVEKTEASELRSEIPIGRGVSIFPNSGIYNPYLHALSRKVRGNKKLHYALYRKIGNCNSLVGLASFCTGKQGDTSRSKHYFKRLEKRFG